MSQVLQRLAKTGEVQYISHGLWQRPKLTRFGPVSASPEKVVAAIERRREVFIVPCGAKVLNEIGATAQVPMKYRFLSTKPIRTIKLGKMSIEFEYSSAFASVCTGLTRLPEAERRLVAGLWGAFVYAGQKDARLQATAFRRAFDTLSLSGQELLLSRLSGNLRWAETLLKGSAANEGES
ncbi:DUF6088 family protein [Marinobacter nauticus]|uniref:DUF6088 family protein n=1 Tax=Marinobacter nauticus TaxID=2743 RepID=UPI001A907C23|nr:DUF6088 family protein [Marinobacter nauticus]MBN8241249.1 hypothetical protein [Marinobacter nauticus]